MRRDPMFAWVHLVNDLARNPYWAAAGRLAALFRRNGYLRRQDRRRMRREGTDQYKKGDEVRLVANSRAELRRIRRWLREAGFHPGRPFVKGCQFRQPLYGREAVARFLALVDSVVPVPSGRSAGSSR